MTTLRADGRPSSSLRPLACELGSLQNCDGSALWKSGTTHILASVHGPLAPRLVHHEREAAVLSVVIKSGNGSSGGGDGPASTYEREWEHVLTTALSSAIVLESYPRSVIQIVIQILSADGSLLAACLHAAVSALLDAGVELHFLPTASTCLLPNGEESTTSNAAVTVSLDPTSLEEQSAGAMVIITTPDNKILASHTSFVEVSIETLLKCCSVACRAGPAVIAFWRLVLEQKATREAQTLWA